MNTLYPTRFEEIGAWARTHGVPATQVRERFAQYCVLWAVSQLPELKNHLVFKGGNALDFVWFPNRSTKDLDFTGLGSEWDPDSLRIRFDQGLQEAGNVLGILARVQKVHQNPPGPNRTMPTFQITVGYALPDDSRNHQRLKRGEPSMAIIHVEVSVNECVCGVESVTLEDGASLQVATLEDIIAEKLRALLQQIPRKRNRPQDLLDIASVCLEDRPLDPRRIRGFLEEKAKVRDIDPSESAFLAPELWERAQFEYSDLESTAKRFIPFEEAKAHVLAFVRRLYLNSNKLGPDEATWPEGYFESWDPIGDDFQVPERLRGNDKDHQRPPSVD